MKLVPISVEPMGNLMQQNTLIAYIGKVAGECYNSSKDTEACIRRALNCIKCGHHSPWENYNITLKCTVDRGTSHALVRHRHCAFQQSSTIYQKFDEIKCIDPSLRLIEETIFLAKLNAYKQAEKAYHDLLIAGELPASARDVLPTALATNLIITTNVRQWMYMIQRRCGAGDSDNMHIWCQKTREWFMLKYPRIVEAFDHWYEKHPL